MPGIGPIPDTGISIGASLVLNIADVKEEFKKQRIKNCYVTSLRVEVDLQ